MVKINCGINSKGLHDPNMQTLMLLKEVSKDPWMLPHGLFSPT